MKLNHKTTKKLRKKAKQTRNNNTKKGKIPDQNVAKKFLKSQLLACRSTYLTNLPLFDGTVVFINLVKYDFRK